MTDCNEDQTNLKHKISHAKMTKYVRKIVI